MKKKELWLLIFILILVVANYFNINIFSYIDKDYLIRLITVESQTNKDEIKPVNTTSKLRVYYLDVGEAESILVQNMDEFMLIDAGNNDDGKNLVDYIKSDIGLENIKVYHSVTSKNSKSPEFSI